MVFDSVGGERDYAYTVKGVMSITGKRIVEEVLSTYLCAFITSAAVDYQVLRTLSIIFLRIIEDIKMVSS